MDHLPLFVTLRGRSALLVGDGPAADAKRRLIEGAGGRAVREPEAETRIAFVAIEGEAAPTEAARLKAAGLLVNVVDRPELCDFIVPAIVDRSPVVVAIGTGGASASLAKSLRERLEALLPAALGGLARSVRARRGDVGRTLPTIEERRRFWDALMTPGAPLDPLRPADDADAAIAAALAGPPEAPDRLVTVELTSDDPDELTLRQLRALSQADAIYVTPDVPAAVIDRGRRDAARVVCTAPPADRAAGYGVFLTRRR